MIALWRHGIGAWHNPLFLTTASNVNSRADFVDEFTQTRLNCGKFGDRENNSMARYGWYHWLELLNYGIKLVVHHDVGLGNVVL